jgi:hypothetical protein
MKKLIYLSFIFLIAACDKIDNPYPVIEGVACDEVTPTFPQNTDNKRYVLVEDLTGHRCNNCPGAAYQIDTIKQNVGKQVIPVGLHVTLNFAGPDPSKAPKYQSDFRTPGGTEVYDNLTPNVGLPAIMVNRIDTFTSPKRFNIYYTSNNLSPNVRSLINTVPKARMQLITSFDASSNKVCAFAETELLANLSDDHSIVFYLLEDNVVDYQLYNGNGGDPAYSAGDISNYVHKHVLRKVMNGWQGKTIITGGSTSIGDKIIEGSSFVVSDGNWRINQLEVVAFVYNNRTKEVIQAVVEKL